MCDYVILLHSYRICLGSNLFVCFVFFSFLFFTFKLVSFRWLALHFVLSWTNRSQVPPPPTHGLRTQKNAEIAFFV